MQSISSPEQFHPERLTVFYFNKKDFSSIHWMEAKKEFRYNGKLYDVFKIVNHNDVIFIHCKNDTAEDHLFASLEDHVINQVSTSNPIARKKLLSVADKLYCLNDDKHAVILYGAPVYLSDLVLIQHSRVYFEISSPPPKIA